MRSVDVTELQDNLRDFLKFAKSGEIVVIRDRDIPVAKLVPLADNEISAP
jgi:antitoxin (DNA-binding transcriptional repressor) of toxin-antitoxin stability system